MKRYEVECWLTTVTVTVEADDDDAAIDAAQDEIIASALNDATWRVREVESDD